MSNTNENTNKNLTLRAIVKDLHRNNLAPTKAQVKRKRGAKSSMKNSWSAKVFALFTFTHKFPKDKREFILDNDTLWEYTLSNLCTPIIAKYFLLICKIEIFGKNIFHRIPYSEFLYTDVENLSVEKQQFFNRRKGHFSTISPYDVSLPNSKEYVPTLLRSKERAKEIKEQMDKEERKNSLREKIKKNMASRN